MLIFLTFFYKNLVILSVASGRITIASFVSALRAPVASITSFVTILFALDNGFLKLFFRKLKRKNSEPKN